MAGEYLLYQSACDIAKSADGITGRLRPRVSLDVLLLSLLVVEISLERDSLLSERYLLEIPLSESAMLGALEVLERSTIVFLSRFPSRSENRDLYSDFSKLRMVP